jgi:putative transposase
MRTLLHSVYDQPDSDSIGAQYDRITDALADKLPKVADHLEDARADLLASTAFPKQIWRQTEWAESRRYLGLDVLNKSRADQSSPAEQEDTLAALTA